MQPKLIKTQHAQYVPGVFSGANETGWEPIDTKVLILTDQPAERTAGGIWITQEANERMAMAAETGVLVALGPGAFVWTADRTRPFAGRKPEPGDYVYIQRYAGQVILGNDGQLYRLMDDNCVAAVRYDHKTPDDAGGPVYEPVEFAVSHSQIDQALADREVVTLKEFDEHH